MASKPEKTRKPAVKAARRPGRLGATARKALDRIDRATGGRTAQKTPGTAVARGAAARGRSLGAVAPPQLDRTPAPDFDAPTLQALLLEVVRKTSAELPEDVVRAIEAGHAEEESDSNALWAMDVIQDNIELAKAKSQPLCQDTGSILFYVHAPKSIDEPAFRTAAGAAVAEATAKGYLRQNSVDSLTGRNTGNNLGPGSPVIHFHQWDEPELEIRLMLKGGGCENVGVQYSLPDTRLKADRDLAGVEKCILDAVYSAQGKGCGPGVLGVAVGGDRATGYAESKAQLLRPLDDVNGNVDLADLERRAVKKANDLGVGPMGFGGKTTLLGCKIGALNRLPASFFVSVSYMCWAYRRQGAEISPDGAIVRWLY